MNFNEILDHVFWRSYARQHFWFWAIVWYSLGELLNVWFNPKMAWLGGAGENWTPGIEAFNIVVCLLLYPVFYYYIWGKKKIENEARSNDSSE